MAGRECTLGKPDPFGHIRAMTKRDEQTTPPRPAFRVHRPADATEASNSGANAANSAPSEASLTSPVKDAAGDRPKELGGPKGPEPTRFGDWERDGRCVDF